MKKNIKQLFLILAMLGLFIFPTNAFADTSRINLDNINIEDIKIYPTEKSVIQIDMDEFNKLSVEEQTKAINYIKSIGLDNFKEEVSKRFQSHDDAFISPQKSSMYKYESRRKSRSASYDDEKTTKHHVEFDDESVIEYYSTIEISVIMDNGKITEVDGYSFDIGDMGPNGSFGHVRTNNYVSKDGENAGSTVNYEVYFKYFIGNIIPMSYTEKQVDYIIVHASDFE